MIIHKLSFHLGKNFDQSESLMRHGAVRLTRNGVTCTNDSVSGTAAHRKDTDIQYEKALNLTMNKEKFHTEIGRHYLPIIQQRRSVHVMAMGIRYSYTVGSDVNCLREWQFGISIKI